ncbi:MAG TPA: hypothetical protein VHK90_13115 [Thermoanaerobaculia bacterium]|nr:hypothetical protein [Thermoanaerobaculia bacterium]
MKDHTLYVREGRWQISGSTIDVAGNPNIAVGLLVVSRSGELWIAEEQLNELQTRLTILPLENGASTTRFNGVSGVMGEVDGALAFFDDIILTTYGSKDGAFRGIESLRMLDDDRYETRGALFRDGGHVSSWSYMLTRA